MESNFAKLRRRYPTVESLEIAAKAAGSKANLAREIGVKPHSFADYARSLKKPVKRAVVPRENNCDLTDKELDARIKEMYGCKYGEVTVYRLTEGYVSGQNGTEGLEFVRTEVGRGGMSLWGRGRG